MTNKKNCWEIMNCGREPNGVKVGELGVCPATMESKLDSVHGGTHAGRACWVVAGSLCGGNVQGSFATKVENCEKCDVYATVKEEEFPYFQHSSMLLSQRRGWCHSVPSVARGHRLP